MIITILIFIIILGLLVFVHEFGHFWVAKKSGMKVEEFGFGFPPRLGGIYKINGKWKLTWGHRDLPDAEGTIYSINAIPLGGFVRILGENNESVEDPRSFINQSAWKRFFVLIAGVFMNFVLAWVVISIGLMISLPSQIENINQAPTHAVITDPRIILDGVVANDPAAKAGLMDGDVVRGVDGANLTSADDLVKYIRAHADQQLTLNIQRLNEKLNIKVTPEKNPDLNNQGFIGSGLAQIANVHYPWYYALWEGLAGRDHGVIFGVWNILVGLWGLITGHVAISNVGGPVAIAKLVGQARRLGFLTLLQFTAFLSLNLAILNTLPFPALDGGRILFLIIEKIRRKRNNPAVEQFVNTVGFVLLLLLMVAVTVKDVIHK